MAIARRACRWAVLAGCAALLAFAAAAGAQTTVSFNPIRDNTLYEDADGLVSNAQGVDIFAGRTDIGQLRRAALRFDLSSIPPGSTVSSATLTLRVNRTRANSADSMTLHRALAAWGEGTSNATNQTGRGAPATTADATWVHTFYPNQFWAAAGGDYAATASATTSVGTQNGPYSWSSGAGIIGDVQSWIDNPTGNFGWVVKVDESQNTTARRFDSSEATTVANRPLLTITYTPPVSPTGACCLTSGACSVTTLFNCTQLGGTYQGDAAACEPNPCPQPSGACCLPGAICVIDTQSGCSAQSGIYQGNGTSCTPNPCTPSTNVTLTAVLDNSLYEDAAGALSNGAGQGVIVGTTNSPALIRRGLMKFDLSSLPANAQVLSASLQLYLSFTQDPGSNAVSLHRALASWGEGTSDASGQEVGGAASTTNDATWLHRFYSSVFWTAPGGDFAPTASASTTVGITLGFYNWSSSGMTADVQAWIDDPGANHGWLLRGNEAAIRSQRRFDSRQGATAGQRPQLTVTYTLAAPTGACCLEDGLCEVLTEVLCASMGGAYQGNGTGCAPNPCPQPSGACCFDNASCQVLTQADCLAQGGAYQGDSSGCLDVTCPLILEPFVDELPRAGVAMPVSGVPGGAAHYEIAIQEAMQQLHRDLPPTRIWGYSGLYPGPTIEARRGETVTVTWINDLRHVETGELRTTHALPVDTCLHGPDMTGQVPVTVVHVHGAKVSSDSDGHPDESFPPGQQSHLYTYPNDQPAATIWYHDHALGITRLNVYMGMAAFYLIRDDAEDALNLPRGEFEIAMAIQDRSFNPDGSFKYQEMWHEHFFGDVALVNGKVWPYLNVKQGKYRFRVVAGSSSRAYTLALSDGAVFWQIGTDNGLLEAPVAMSSLTLTPGERADVVVDFGSYPAGTELILTNSAPSPFPTGGVDAPLPQIMKFIVQGEAGDTDPLPAALVSVPRIPEEEAVLQRDLELRKGPNHANCPEHTDGVWMINNLMWHDITEFPRIGDTEIWAWVNRSGVTHPMHMHLVSFQVLDRQDFDIVDGEVVPVGERITPPANELGWKDTVQAHPGQITRVIATFDGEPGLYPYHCHILEHEDHEMMRQFRLVCAGDFDYSGTVAVPDIFAFLSAWFAQDERADFDRDDTIAVPDIFAFLSAWFAGCSR